MIKSRTNIKRAAVRIDGRANKEFEFEDGKVENRFSFLIHPCKWIFVLCLLSLTFITRFVLIWNRCLNVWISAQAGQNTHIIFVSLAASRRTDLCKGITFLSICLTVVPKLPVSSVVLLFSLAAIHYLVSVSVVLRILQAIIACPAPNPILRRRARCFVYLARNLPSKVAFTSNKISSWYKSQGQNTSLTPNASQEVHILFFFFWSN